MFISDKYKLVFFEVPRTGSNSVTAALGELDPDSPTMIARSQTSVTMDYHRFEIPDYAKDYALIAAHRNPYERIWSHWKFRHRYGNPEVFRTTPWHRYVKWVCEPGSVPEIQNAMLDVPIIEMFDSGQVAHWLSFESLTESWQELAEGLDLDLPSLQVKQASSFMGDYRDAYDGELAAMIAKRFAQDFELFGYDVDSWKKQPVAQLSSGKDKPTVAILTHFEQSLAAFSLNRVVQDQITMLNKHGYKPKVLVIASDAWDKPADNFGLEEVELIQYPRFAEEIDEDNPNQMAVQVQELCAAFAEALGDVDVVLTHDIIYMGRSKKIMKAARLVADRLPELRWLHWIHSAANPNLLNKGETAQKIHDELIEKKWPNSYPIFFNRMSIPRIAANFGYAEEQVKIIPHPVDVTTFMGFSELSTRIYEECGLYDADFVTVCPTRLNMTKQIDWIIKIMARLKSNGARVRTVFIDFHSLKDEAVKYREKMKGIADDWGLNNDELIFLSEFDDEIKFEAPHQMVRELLSISNVYIQSSVSESYSLAAQEAGLMGNLLILNADFPPMQEMYGDNALYYHFSSYINRDTLQNGQTVSRFEDVEFEFYPEGMVPDALISERDGGWVVSGEVAYADLIAREIQQEFSENKILAQRQQRLRDRNVFSVFRDYLEPLLYR